MHSSGSGSCTGWRGRRPPTNIPTALRLEGDLHADALLAALGDVVAHHESLRTTFPDEDGVPYQRILPPAEGCPATGHRGCHRGGAGRSPEPWRRPRPSTWPGRFPCGPWLFRLGGPARHALLLLLHHIAGDGWSLGVLLRDLARAYAARSRGSAPAFAELPVQYADYALWQRELLGEEDDPDSPLVRQLEFWRTALTGAPEELDLPADRVRPAGDELPRGGRAGADRVRTAPAPAGAGSGPAGATLFMVLQAGLAAPTVAAGRRPGHPDRQPRRRARRGERWRKLVGFFVNTLVLRHRRLRQPELHRTGEPGASVCSRGLLPPGTCRSSEWSMPCSRHGRWRGIPCSR